MLEKLIGIKSLEKTEPIELEEVPNEEAPQMPAEYDHTVPLAEQMANPEDLEVDEVVDEPGDANGNA